MVVEDVASKVTAAGLGICPASAESFSCRASLVKRRSAVSSPGRLPDNCLRQHPGCPIFSPSNNRYAKYRQEVGIGCRRVSNASRLPSGRCVELLLAYGTSPGSYPQGNRGMSNKRI